MIVRLRNGKIVEVPDGTGARLIRKGRAVAMTKGPNERAVMQRAVGR